MREPDSAPARVWPVTRHFGTIPGIGRGGNFYRTKICLLGMSLGTFLRTNIHVGIKIQKMEEIPL